MAAGIASGVVQASAIVPYVKDTLRGSVRPNAISWLLWTTLQVIVVLAQFAAGASWSIILPLVMTFNTGLITVLALVGYGYKKYGLLDWICFFLAAYALALWYVTGNPVLALVLIIFANFLAALPTFVKTYREPESESLGSWSLVVLASLLSVASTAIRNVANLIFPAYLLFESVLICTFTFFRWSDRNERRFLSQ